MPFAQVPNAFLHVPSSTKSTTITNFQFNRCPRCNKLQLPNNTSTLSPFISQTYKSNMNPTITMKSKKRAHSQSQPSSFPEIPKNTEPIRINNESSNLSLRQQLQLADERRQASQPQKPVLRTRFRRKKDINGIRSKEDLSDTDMPDGKYNIRNDPVLFIDGYNVICTWPRLRKWRDKADLDTARCLLISDVAEFSHVRGWDCITVFDAYGTEEGLKTETTPQNVKVVYTGTETADSYIERRVYELCEEGHRQIWAATSDVAQLRYSTAKGAHVMSSKLFIQEIKRAKKETKERVQQKDGEEARGKMLISNVDESTREKLYRLRDHGFK